MKLSAVRQQNAKNQHDSHEIIDDFENKSIQLEAQFNLVGEIAGNVLKINDGAAEDISL